MNSFDQVLIPALRRSYQDRCEVLFFLEGESHTSLPFDKATPVVHFPKALKRPRNNAGPASIYIYREREKKKETLWVSGK